MDQRKIVHIIPNLSRGGAERFVVDLCNALSGKSAAEIHLISMYNNPAGTTLRKEVHAKVIYHELSKRPGLDMKFLYRLFQLLRRIEPDVVHTHINTLEYALPYTLRYKRPLISIPCITTRLWNATSRFFGKYDSGVMRRSQSCRLQSQGKAPGLFMLVTNRRAI